MAIYNFQFDPPRSVDPDTKVYQGSQTQGIDFPEKLPDYSQKKPAIAEPAQGDMNLAPEEIIQVTNRGFYVLDEGMKTWLSGIKVPTRDGYKTTSAHIASHDRSILIWAQEFFNGRVELPILSIHRQSWAFDPRYFSPPYRPFRKIFTDKSMRKVRVQYRPIPFLVEYNVAIWGEFKTDVEYINSDIITRTNPLGEFDVEDEHLQQIARVKNNGTTNQADIEVDAKTKPKVVYEMSFSVEYTLPVNEKVVPTILGRVVSIKEMDTHEVFDTYRIDDIR